LSKALAYAATSKTSPLGPITISRRELRSNDVNIEILYCEVCHSLVGGIKETQEMLDFCAKSGVVAETETIPMQEIETAFARIVKNDVKYRFVVDIKSVKRNI
jgi:D-arabinose 1-dehydrogenase-like Zn-dependent alcohol dehydrogenase